MTVSIRLTGDTNNLQQGIKNVQQEYDRLRQRIQGMNREAREFEKMDLSDLGGDMADGFRKAQIQWQQLLDAIPQLRKRIAASGQGGAAPWDIDFNRKRNKPAVSLTAQRGTQNPPAELLSALFRAEFPELEDL
jgi:hypothetical protein